MALPNVIHTPWLRLKRVAQTNLILQKNALQWMMGDRPPAPELLRKVFEDLGTTYVKIGQLIASMPSVFPEEYVQAFQGCLDQTRPLPFEQLEKTLRRELGDPDLHFSWIDPQPLASASIAQVHAARLHTGEEVVIKIQRPDAQDILKADLSALHSVTRVLEVIAPKLKHVSLADMAEEIKVSMLEECNFEQEASNIATYRDFLQSIGNRDVVVPKVYAAASTKRVLTMERFFGVPLTDLDAVRVRHPHPDQALMNALHVWFESVRRCRIYHADLHSGNIMMLNDGRIGFIDFGIVGSISEQVWQALMTLSTALPVEDFDTAAEALMQLGATKENIDTEALANELRQFYQQLMFTNNADLSDLDSSLQEVMLNLTGIGKRYGIRFPRSFTLLIKQLLYFDRYTKALAPDLDVWQQGMLIDQ
jgi:predicted unusual protein kinase regulating ubiquinone biosynthesis (AarF/ABC1/UbiB family)